MKVYLPEQSGKVGGGWTFIDNLSHLIETAGYEQADIFFIAGATMVARDEVQKAMSDGKKIVLRVDNVLRHSRNRGTGMPRMKDFAGWADLVIFQSAWAKETLNDFLKVPEAKTKVILNGVDKSRFYTDKKIKNSYIYSRVNRDETKGWEVARFWFARQWVNNNSDKLFIVGNFSPDLVDADFDFYNGETYQFIPTLDLASYAVWLRQMEHFIYTYYNDACSNSLIEALACGCQIIDPHHFLETGGAPEIIAAKDLSLERMAKQYQEAFDELA